MKKRLTYLLILLAGGIAAQDLHFSQYAETPSLVNPALSGFHYAMRASIIYRDQWRSVATPYRTFNAGAEMKFKGSDWQKNGTRNRLTRVYKKGFSPFAAGISFTSDKAGNANMGLTQVHLTLASFIPLDQRNTLSLGIQAGVVQRKIDIAALSFPDQYNGHGAYDQSISPGENALLQRFSYPDLSAGLAWTFYRNTEVVGGNNQFRSTAGIAAFHLNRPYLQFLANSAERVSIRYVGHADLLIEVPNTNLAFVPAFIFSRQNTSSELVAGAMVKYYFADDSRYTGTKKRSAISIGVSYRNKDALIYTTCLEYERYAIGVSYDHNISKLAAASRARGGAEIFLRFNSARAFLFQTNRSRI